MDSRGISSVFSRDVVFFFFWGGGNCFCGERKM